MKEEGVLFQIKHQSSQDGPGLRTVLMLKGCPLRCVWCHNPEARSFKPQLVFEENNCHNCFTCITSCKNMAHFAEGDHHEIHFDNCEADGYCVKTCPFDAVSISGKPFTVDEAMDLVLPEIESFRANNGGITLSGGEPMSQFGFTLAFLKRANELNIHTCLDTSGYAKTAFFEEVSPYVDMFLFDYKETDPSRHQEFTGVNQQLILKNLEFLVNHNKKVILRCPIIPGYNDSDVHFKGIAALSNQYKIEVQLIPFDDLAESKAKQMGIELPMAEFIDATPEMYAYWVSTLHDLGCEVKPF